MENISLSNSSSLKAEFDVVVYYEDTDFSGYVYHANYLKFMERAREHLLGINFIVDLFHSGFHFVVRDLTIKYVNPAKHGDNLRVFSEMEMSNSPKCVVTQNIYSNANPPVLITSAQLKLAFVNSVGRPCRIPEHILQHLMNSDDSNK